MEPLPQRIKRASELAFSLAQHRSYAPYSKYRVGAVIADADTFYEGVNVENSSYGLTICAERAAIFNWASHGSQFNAYSPIKNRPIEFLLYTALYHTQSFEYFSPCGACLQVMLEFMDSESRVIHFNHDIGNVRIWRLRELIPYANPKIVGA